MENRPSTASEPEAGPVAGDLAQDLVELLLGDALLVDSERRPLGWLSESDLRQELVPATPHISPDPVIDRDDVMRDALSDVLQHETMYAPVVDADRRIAGIRSVEIISEFLGSRDALSEEHPAVERPTE